MDERELQALVRMAMEVEGLEGAAAPRLVRTGAGRRRALPWVGGAAAALAACVGVVAVAWVTWPGSRPGPAGAAAAGGLEAQPTVRADAPVSETEPADPWVLLAIYRGWDGECRCLHVERPELAAKRPLEAIRPSELLAMGLEASCSATVERLIVLGISGPAEELPTTTDQAEVVAACLASAGPTDSSMMAVRAESCLPAGVTVVAELLEVDRPLGFR